MFFATINVHVKKLQYNTKLIDRENHLGSYVLCEVKVKQTKKKHTHTEKITK